MLQLAAQDLAGMVLRSSRRPRPVMRMLRGWAGITCAAIVGL